MSKTPSEDEILQLARQAGLVLPDEYGAELIEAYGHVRQMLDRMSMVRPRSDEPAHVFVPSSFLPPEGKA